MLQASEKEKRTIEIANDTTREIYSSSFSSQTAGRDEVDGQGQLPVVDLQR
jgi:hypothetical protein